MGHQIIKQPDGKLAVYSTADNEFLLLGATLEDIVSLFVKEHARIIKKDVHRIVDLLEKDRKPYYQFTRTWTEAVEDIIDQHGETDTIEWLRENKLIE